MKCKKCGMMLPVDSEFCQFCGSPIVSTPIPKEIETTPAEKPFVEQATSPSSPTEEDNVPSSTPHVIISTTDHSTSEIQHTDSQSAKAQRKNKTKTILIFSIVLVSIISLAALNIIQYVIHRGDQQRLTKAEASIKELNSANEELSRISSEQENTIQNQQVIIDDQSSTLRTQDNTITSLRSKAKTYDLISSALKSGNIGYASSNFNCSQSIILVKRGDSKKITLTANWRNGGTVELNYSSNAASVDFDQNSWAYSTTLSIKGNSAGVSVVTFSNNVDSKEFKIIIIVE